jgi:putative two-component system response regulator
MKTHTTIGASILSGSKSALVRMAEEIARHHHERWDGSGYPDGLEGNDIPLAARICAVCDVFDALLSPRPYKDAWPLADVIRELRSLRGTHLEVGGRHRSDHGVQQRDDQAGCDQLEDHHRVANGSRPA